jgi:hypothetical protein
MIGDYLLSTSALIVYAFVVGYLIGDVRANWYYYRAAFRQGLALAHCRQLGHLPMRLPVPPCDGYEWQCARCSTWVNARGQELPPLIIGVPLPNDGDGRE